MKSMLFCLVILIISYSCAEKEKLGIINYQDPLLTAEKMEKHIAIFYDKKNYKEVEKAYEWIQEKEPEYFEKNLKIKQIELYGIQGRYEKQLDIYNQIFPSDSVDNVEYVPLFFYHMGNSYNERAYAPGTGDVDTAMIELAIGYYRKSFSYDLFKEEEIQANAAYKAGLLYGRLDKREEAYKLYEKVVNDFPKSSVHKKSYFKLEDAASPVDIVLSRDQEMIYSQRFQPVQEEKAIVQNTNTAVQDNNLVENKTDSLNKNIKKETVKEIKTDSVKQEVKKTNLDEFQKVEEIPQDSLKNKQN